jgi:hypothetical protein
MALSVVVLCLGVFSGTQFTNRVKATTVASQTEISQLAPNALAFEYQECNVGIVYEWIHYVDQPASEEPSVMIECLNASGIRYFAQPLTDSKRAARILSIALTARALNKPLGIDYDLNDTNVVGCSSGNCRNIVRVLILE